MFRYIVRRLLQIVLAFFGATFILFMLMVGIAKDPVRALAGEKPLPASTRQLLTEQYHLDEPGWMRYLLFMKQLLLHGDLGNQLQGQRPITTVLAETWPYTVRLALMAFIFQAIFGLTIGIISGIRRKGVFDYSSLAFTLLIISIPIFVLGSVLRYLLGVKIQIFPINASEGTFGQLLLPAMVLGALGLATVARLTRTSLSENLRADYVRTARAKGLTKGRVVGVHVLRNSLIPVVTLLGVHIGDLMAGAIVTERLFNIPGVGNAIFRALTVEDGPTVVGFATILVIVYLVCNLVVDLLYAVLDPRIRYD